MSFQGNGFILPRGLYIIEGPNLFGKRNGFAGEQSQAHPHGRDLPGKEVFALRVQIIGSGNICCKLVSSMG
jgi:hypothetical protein